MNERRAWKTIRGPRGDTKDVNLNTINNQCRRIGGTLWRLQNSKTSVNSETWDAWDRIIDSFTVKMQSSLNKMKKYWNRAYLSSILLLRRNSSNYMRTLCLNPYFINQNTTQLWRNPGTKGQILYRNYFQT